MAEEKSTTYAVKLDTEVKEELQKLLEGYKEQGVGSNAGDFIKTLLEVYKTNKIVNKISSTEADIKELNTLTNRIYKIYSNLLERMDNSNSSLQLEFKEVLNKKDKSIESLKIKLNNLETEYYNIEQEFNNLSDYKEKLEKENDQISTLNKSNKLLIEKLQDEILNLKEVKETNNKLLKDIEAKKNLLEGMEVDNKKLSASLNEKKNFINSLNKIKEEMEDKSKRAFNELQDKYQQDLKNLKEKLDLEKDKAILELEKKYQKDIQDLKANHNKEIEGYQERYKNLLGEIEHSKKA